MIQVRCVIDNLAQRSSQFWGEHGLSFHIKTGDGQVLFDTGQSGEVLLHNLHQFGIDLKKINALALSHAHYDHTGGMLSLLPHLRSVIPVYAHPDIFRDRYSLHGNERVSIGMEASRADLARRVDLHLSDQPTEIIPGVWTTGEIVQRHDFEGRSAGHEIMVDGQWLPDPYRDDLSLVIETVGGLVVLCGCCHAGLLNTLNHVRQHFKRGVTAVIGGTHLISVTDDMLERAIEVLDKTYGVTHLYPNHCTGERAFVALRQAFGERVQSCPAGTLLTF